MKLTVGRIAKADALEQATPVIAPFAEKTLPRGQVVPEVVLQGAERAQRLIGEAEARAAQIVAQAEQRAADLRLRAEAEGRAEAAASIAARALALRHHEARADERAIDRSVELARLLAERLLGESLRVAPEQVASIARQALAEARGARRIVIVAQSDDALILEQALPTLGIDPSLVVVRSDAARPRGNLRIETEIGVLDAELAPQLGRLALKLRESLGHD